MNYKQDRMKKLVKFTKNRQQREYQHRKKVQKRQAWPKSPNRLGKVTSYFLDDEAQNNVRMRRHR